MANSYLSWQNSTATNNTKFTMSAWVKRGNLNSSSYNCIMSCRQTSSTNSMGLWFGEDKVFFNFGTGASTSNTGFDTSAKVRDTNGWYHIVVAGDASQSGTDKLKVWINGTQQTSFVTDNRSNFATLEHDFGNTTYPIQVGRKHDDTFFWDGYMSHVAFVDGTALTPTSFGETDSTSGIWKFKSPTGVTWGNNGFHLKFENSAALGTDSSGNSNTFTVNGNLKQSISTPSNVYNTLNPNYQSTFHSTSRATLANGNTKWTATSNNQSQNGILCTQGVNKGKWYLEAKWAGSYDSALGVAKDNFGMMTAGTGGLQSAGWYGMNTNISNTGGSGMAWWSNNSATGDRGNTISTNDIIMMAIDIDNNKLYFGKNGTWEESGDPTSGASGTGATSTLASDTTYIVACGNYGYSNANSWEFNFGEGRFGTTAISSAGSNGNGSLFEYDVPSGYYALNTKNINTYG